MEKNVINQMGLSFGEAVKAAKEGRLIARAGWNGKGMFVFMRDHNSLDIQTIVHKINTFPQAVKDYYANRTLQNQNSPTRLDATDKIYFTPYFCMKAADDTIVNGWLASQTDMLAVDWTIVVV